MCHDKQQFYFYKTHKKRLTGKGTNNYLKTANNN